MCEVLGDVTFYDLETLNTFKVKARLIAVGTALSLIMFTSLLVLVSFHPSEETYEAYGVRLHIPQGGTLSFGTKTSCLWSLSNNTFVASYSIGICPTKKLGDLINYDYEPYEPSSTFQVGENLSNNLIEFRYGQFKRFDKDHYLALCLVELSDMLTLVFETTGTSTDFDQHMEVLNSVMARVELVDEGKVQIQNTSGGLHLDVYNLKGKGFLIGNGNGRPRLSNGKSSKELVLVWNDVAGAYHIARLDKDGTLIDQIDFGTKAIYDAVAHKDGIAVLASKPVRRPESGCDQKDCLYRHLNLEKYSWKGKQLFSTHIVGVDEIQKVDDQSFAYWGAASTRLAWSGEYYAAHFSTYKKWSDNITHQADAYVILDPNGKNHLEIDTHRSYSSLWSVSHSFSQELVFDGEKFVRFSLGDAHPRAIAVKRCYPEKTGHYSIKENSFLEFPGKIGDNYVYNTRFGNPIVVDQHVIFPYDTELGTGGDTLNFYSDDLCNDLFIEKLDRKCQIASSFRLTNTPDIEERNLSIANLGSGRLLCKWQTYRIAPKNKESFVAKGLIGCNIGIFNLKIGEWETQELMRYIVGSKSQSEFKVPGYGTSGLPGMSNDHEVFTGSQLFQDNTGRIWFVRFKTKSSGFELVEVKAE